MLLLVASICFEGARAVSARVAAEWAAAAKLAAKLAVKAS